MLRKISRFFREFAPENPAKFCFFFREISEALIIRQVKKNPQSEGQKGISMNDDTTGEY